MINQTNLVVESSANKAENSLNNCKTKCSTSSSSETYKDLGSEANNSVCGVISELKHNFTDYSELDTDQSQPAKQKGKIYDMLNESSTNLPSNNTARNEAESPLDKIKVNSSRNSKKNASSSSSSSRIISSLKSWTYSLINHQSKQNSQNRRHRSSRNMNNSTNVETINGCSGIASQTVDNATDAFRTNISDEELARRIQIEELNNLGAFHITENNSSIPPNALGSFQDVNHNFNTTISLPNNTTVSPFQGTPYKFEFESSDDEQ